jgi:hypothetical protein
MVIKGQFRDDSQNKSKLIRSGVEGAMKHGPVVWFPRSEVAYLSIPYQAKQNIASLESLAD